MQSLTPADIIVGVDTHKHDHAAVARSGLGARLGAIAVPAASRGYQQLEAWACALRTVRAFVIEGTGSYGAGLARALMARGHTVIEVERMLPSTGS